MTKKSFDRPEIEKAPTGISGLDEITGGGLPAGRPTLVFGGPGSGKTLLGISVPGERRAAVRRARRADDASRRTPTSWRRTSRSLGFDLHDAGRRREAAGRLRARRAQRDRGNRRVRPRRPVRPPRSRDQSDRRQARRARHHRDRCSAASRTRRSCAPSCGGCSAGCATAASTAVITGERGEQHADPAGARGVRHRRGDPARSPRARSDLHAPPPGRQVPRLAPRHQRVPVPDRSRRHQRAAGHVAAAAARGARPNASPAGSRRSTRCSAARATTAAAPSWCPGTAGTGKTTLAAHFVDAACRARRDAACTSCSRSRRSRCSATCARRASTSQPLGGQGPAAVPCRPAVAHGLETHLADHAPRGRAVRARRRGHRPDDQPDDGRDARSTCGRCSRG